MYGDESIAGTCMQAQSLNRGQVLIDRLADQCVSELVAARGVGVRLSDTRLYGRFENGQYALHVLVHGGGDFTSREIPAMNFRDGQHFVAPVGEPALPSADRLAYAGRNSCWHRRNCTTGALIDKALNPLAPQYGDPLRL